MASKITGYTVTHIDAAGDYVVTVFDQRDEAWKWMRLCETNGVVAGFPHPRVQAVS